MLTEHNRRRDKKTSRIKTKGSVNILMGLFKKQTTHKKIKRALL